MKSKKYKKDKEPTPFWIQQQIGRSKRSRFNHIKINKNMK